MPLGYDLTDKGKGFLRFFLKYRFREKIHPKSEIPLNRVHLRQKKKRINSESRVVLHCSGAVLEQNSVVQLGSESASALKLPTF